jgi:hypothetical protein
MSQELSIGRLFGQLLPTGLRCAVMGVEETDAVQVSQGELCICCVEVTPHICDMRFIANALRMGVEETDAVQMSSAVTALSLHNTFVTCG